MAIKHKRNNIYSDIVNTYLKKEGVYTSVLGVYEKVNGAYALVSSSLPTVTSIIDIGDSITVGSAATTTPQAWCYLSATRMGINTAVPAQYLNQGIGSTVLQNNNGSGGTPLPSNGRDRITGMGGINKRDYARINYGYNDARYIAAPATMNAAGYKNDLGQCVAFLFEAGYTRENIQITSPYYITDVGLNTGTGGFSGQTRAGFEAYVTAAREVAEEWGVRFYNVYDWMIINGGASLISPDDIHPNDAGHLVISNGNFTSYNYLANTNAAIVFTSNKTNATTAAYSITAPSKAVTNYTIEYALNETYDYGNAVNVTALSGNVTVPDGGVRLRVRANFTDGSRSPWSISPVMVVPGVFFLDTFTDTNGTAITAHVPNNGGTWTVMPSYAPAQVPLINDDRVYGRVVSSWYHNLKAPPSPDYFVEAEFDYLTGIAGDFVGLVMRSYPGSNAFYFARYAASTGGVQLSRRLSGQFTALSPELAVSFTSGTLKIKIQAVGTTLQVWVNDVLRHTTTDSGLPLTGYPGFVDNVAGKTATTGIQLSRLTASSV